jgi:hypothetical protein
MCKMTLSTPLPEIFLVIKRNGRGMVINVYWSSWKYPFSCQMVVKLEPFPQIIENYSNINFHENPSRGNRAAPWRRTARRANITKLIVALRNMANAPKNCKFHYMDTLLNSSPQIEIIQNKRMGVTSFQLLTAIVPHDPLTTRMSRSKTAMDITCSRARATRIYVHGVSWCTPGLQKFIIGKTQNTSLRNLYW